MSSPTHYPSTPKRPTAFRNSYYTTPSPPTYHQRSWSRLRIPSSPLIDKTPATKTCRMAKSDSMVFTDSLGSPGQRSEDPLKSFLRQKFRTRCLERAVKAREEQVRRRRFSAGHPSSEPSSDGFDEAMDEDDEEDDDMVMQDELFQRIIESTHRKRQHAYRVSYALEVGSSFDPDMEDTAKWEEELSTCPPLLTSSSGLVASEDMVPPDFDEDEVAAYAEDLAVINELDDIPDDELFSWSDFEDESSIAKQSQQGSAPNEDSDMCIS